MSTLYLNENVDARLIALLSRRGIPATHTLSVGNRGASDEWQLTYAASKGYILVTHNRKHFRRLHQAWLAEGKRHAGIIVVKYADLEQLANRIRLFFELIYPTVSPPFCLSPPRIE